jgi:hypothetical protein
MIEVRKAFAEDYEAVLPLLLKFNPSKEVWKALFTNHWTHPENYFGYVLTDNFKVVGYLGGIFSNREINGQVEKFCNLSAWIIDESYKKHGLSLFLPILQLEDYTITNFSSAEKTYIISKKLGFEDINTRLVYIPPIPQLAGKRKVEIEIDTPDFEKHLDAKDQKIYKDHLKFKAHHIVLSDENEYCYLIIKKEPAYIRIVYYLNSVFRKIFKTNMVQEKLLLGRVHYMSNKRFFGSSVNAFTAAICGKLRIIGLLLDERWLKGSNVMYKKPYKTFSTPVFKTKSLQGEEIDTLYSEHFLINTNS